MSGTAQTQSGDFSPPGKSNGVTDFINNSSNVGKETVQTIASIGIEKAAGLAGKAALGSIGGALVQPAVWVMSGKSPQPGDIELWGMGTLVGLAGPIGAGATIVTGLMKATLEDREDRIIAEAVAREPERYRPFISSVRNYSAQGRGIAAMVVASHGGVTWKVSRSTWVFIRDAGGRLVCDYEPAYAMEIYAPDLPLRVGTRTGGTIRYHWSWKRGNIHG